MSKSTKSEIELLEEISNKIDRLIGIIAIQGKDEDVQIRILKRLGFTSKETGDLTGLTDATVRKRQSWNEA